MRFYAIPATIWTLSAVLMLVAPALCRGSVSNQELATYLRTQPQPQDYTSSINPIIAILTRVERHGGPRAAAVRLAHEWHVSNPVAEALIELVALPDWSSGNRATRERQAADLRLIMARAGDSHEAWGVILHYLDARDSCADRTIEERYFRHPWASADLLHSSDYSCQAWLLDIPRYAAPTALLYARLTDESDDDIDELIAARAFRDSMAREDARPDTPAYLYAQRLYFLELADLGLTHDLLAEAHSLPRGELSLILDDQVAGDVTVDGFPLEPAHYAQGEAAELQECWIVALLEAKRPDEARAWLDHWGWNALLEKSPDSAASGSPWATDLGLDPRALVAHLVLDDKHTDVFDTFVKSKELTVAPLDSPAGRRLAITYVMAHGYPQFAEYLRSQPCYTDEETTRRSWANFPPDFQAVRKELEASVRKAGDFHGDCSPGRMASGDDTLRRRTEHPLPPSLRWTGRRGPARIPVQARAALSEFSVVRYSASGKVAAAISLSQAVDPTGEVSGGGYWLHLSHDGGKTWGKPLYLALQQYEPYDVVSESHLPLLRGRTLQIEVEVKEVDPASVMFPPVALRAKRTARDLYITLSLDDIERDSDGDGLTDLLEEKLHTNPFDADTDHDGLSDADDPLPQVSAVAPMIADSEVVRLALQAIFGYDAAAIITGGPHPTTRAPITIKDLLTAAGAPRGRQPTVLFLESQKALFRGLTLPNTTIILDDAEVRHDERRYGLFYPVSFHLWFNHSHTKAFVLWSASWTGGTLTFTKQRGKWQKPEQSSWIT
jgi:hypothetical protein